MWESLKQLVDSATKNNNVKQVEKMTCDEFRVYRQMFLAKYGNDLRRKLSTENPGFASQNAAVCPSNAQALSALDMVTGACKVGGVAVTAYALYKAYSYLVAWLRKSSIDACSIEKEVEDETFDPYSELHLGESQ